MSNALRGFHRTHGGDGLPLPVLRDHIVAHGRPDAAGIVALAHEMKMPESAVRAALTSYADFRETPGTVRVCDGTSCRLGDRGRFTAERAAGHDVYCLGLCHHPAAALDVDGIPMGESAAPSVRCTAPEPVVTGRLISGGVYELDNARTAGVYSALASALKSDPELILTAIESSGLRGRGGAAFPTGIKWRTCANATGEQKYVVANGDEGDPGSFIDKVLMEDDPHALIEGMLLAAYAVGAEHAIIFVRSEYPAAIARLERAVADARAANLVGEDILGTGFRCTFSVFTAFGSYVCGEETAMLNAIEGFRGEVTLRPPYPAEAGLYGQPTLVNNIETLICVPWIVGRGADAFAALGTDASRGTKAMCLNHAFGQPGIVEVEMGTPLDQVLNDAGMPGPLAAVLLGGPMGSVVMPGDWSLPICYGAMGDAGIQLGHGGLIGVPEDADFADLLDHWVEFMQEESCGKCVPCRLGSRRVLELLREGGGARQREEIDRLMVVMKEGSLCAFGRETPQPLEQLMRHFGDRIFAAGGDA